MILVSPILGSADIGAGGVVGFVAVCVVGVGVLATSSFSVGCGGVLSDGVIICSAIKLSVG